MEEKSEIKFETFNLTKETKTVKEVAKKLKVSRPTVYTFIGLGLKSIKLGSRSVRFRPTEVERFIKSMEKKTK